MVTRQRTGKKYSSDKQKRSLGLYCDEREHNRCIIICEEVEMEQSGICGEERYDH